MWVNLWSATFFWFNVHNLVKDQMSSEKMFFGIGIFEIDIVETDIVETDIVEIDIVEIDIVKTDIFEIDIFCRKCKNVVLHFTHLYSYSLVHCA